MNCFFQNGRQYGRHAQDGRLQKSKSSDFDAVFPSNMLTTMQGYLSTSGKITMDMVATLLTNVEQASYSLCQWWVMIYKCLSGIVSSRLSWTLCGSRQRPLVLYCKLVFCEWKEKAWNVILLVEQSNHSWWIQSSSGRITQIWNVMRHINWIANATAPEPSVV